MDGFFVSVPELVGSVDGFESDVVLADSDPLLFDSVPFDSVLVGLVELDAFSPPLPPFEDP